MKVPTITSQRNAPSRLGFTEVRPSNMGAAISDFGKDVQQFAMTRDEKNAKAMINDKMNQLKEQKRSYMMNVQKERRGKDVLGDSERLSVYQDYSKVGDEGVRAALKDIPSRWQDQAKAQFDSVINGGKDTAARYQAQQEMDYRKDVYADSVINVTKDALGEIAVGGDSSKIVSEGFSQIEALNEDGFSSPEQVESQKSNFLVNAIYSEASVTPKKARELLKNHSEMLSASQINTLTNTIDKEETRIVGTNLWEEVQGLPYPEQQEVIKDSAVTDEQKKYAMDFADQTHKREQNIKISRSADHTNSLFDSIVVNGNEEGYTKQQILTDTKFDVLTKEHRMQVASWVSGGKAGEFDDKTRTMTFGRAKRMILSGQWDVTDVESKMGTEFDRRDYNNLHADAMSRQNGGTPIDDDLIRIVKAKYPKMWKGNEDEVRQLMGKAAIPLMKMSDGYAVPEDQLEKTVDSYLKSLSSFQTGVSERNDYLEDVILDPDKPLTGQDSRNLAPTMAYRYMGEGYSEPREVKKESTVQWVLGELDGDKTRYWYIEGGTTKYVTPESKSYDYIRSLK